VEREHPEYLEAVRAPVPIPAGHTLPPEYVQTPGGRGLFDGRRQEAPAEVSHAGWVATESIRFLEEHAATARSGETPFFLHAGIYAPHPPLFAPPPYDTMYDPAAIAQGPPLPVRRPGEMDDKPSFFRAAAARNAEVPDDVWRRAKAFYYGMVSLADAQIGRVLAALDRLGLAENTVVVFTSDHGEALGDHYVTGTGPTNYDSIVNVPLIARWPAAGADGGLPAGRVVSGLVEHVDVAPTLLEAAGVPAYAGIQGTSLLPLARGATDEGRPDVLIEFRDVKNGFSVKTLRSNDLKYTRSRRNGETEEALFDLCADPHEFANVALDPGHAPALAAMRSRLLDRLQDAEDDLPEPTGVY
jgi:arylsulfatase A-like enzyme